MTFPDDEAGVCSDITCNSLDECLEKYPFDRMRKGEASELCTKEYRGETIVD
jgi:hypothetical protein